MIRKTIYRRAGRSSELTSSGAWDKYFRWNADHLQPVLWELGPQLSDNERTLISASIQEFQLGESSEGRHLIHAAREYSHASGDVDYLRAMERFIREEQRHARELGRFMDLACISRTTKTFSDSVFRRMRHLADLEISVAVLVTAEIIAKVYYPALREATGSTVLKQICDQIIHDEEPHVEFQCQRLAILRARHSWLRLMLKHMLHRILFAGACAVVWLRHRRVLHAGGLPLVRYLSSCWREYRAAERTMNPRSYAEFSANTIATAKATV